jgi:hypothetical protein
MSIGQGPTRKHNRPAARFIKNLAILLLSIHPPAAWSQVLEYPSPLIREEQTVVVNGRTEIWRLQWNGRPKPFCDAESDGWYTCPCWGFAYGEAGELFLTRSLNGAEIDRLHISPLFHSSLISEVALLQRWEPDRDNDIAPGLRTSGNSSAVIDRRPAVQVMHFADYDHDGSKSEFYLQTGAGPCVHTYGIVVGVSRKNPRLHAFPTASHPGRPLEMDVKAWDALRNASGPIEVPVFTCGDHGSEKEVTVKLHWSVDGIDGTRREYTCPPWDRHLLNERRLLEK